MGNGGSKTGSARRRRNHWMTQRRRWRRGRMPAIGVIFFKVAAVTGNGRRQDSSGSPAPEPLEDVEAEARTRTTRWMRPGRRSCGQAVAVEGGAAATPVSVSRLPLVGLGFWLSFPGRSSSCHRIRIKRTKMIYFPLQFWLVRQRISFRSCTPSVHFYLAF
jgi:hypothetical protein